jgi:hypothetical protein
MQHLQLDERASTADCVALRVLGPIGARFHHHFHEMLQTQPALRQLNLQLANGFLYIRDGRHLPGLADACDKLVGDAKNADEHERNMVDEYAKLEEQRKKNSLDEFKRVQGTPQQIDQDQVEKTTTKPIP